VKKNILVKDDLKKLKGKKLSFQVIALLIIAAFLPILCISLGTYYSLSKNLKGEFDNRANQSTTRVNEAIGSLYKANYESTDMLSNDPNAIMIKANPDSEQWLMKSLEGFLKTHPDTLGIYLGTVDKKMYLEPKSDLPAGYDPTSRGWYKDAINNKGKVIATNPYQDAITKKYVMTFAKTVKDNQGKIVGVVGLDIDLELISNMVAGVKLGNSGFSAVLDSTGTIIAHKDKSLLGKDLKQETWIKNIMDSKENKLLSNINGEKYLVYKAWMKKLS